MLRRGCLALLVVFAVACGLPRQVRAAPGKPVRYRISIPKPHTQYVHVQMQVRPRGGGHSDVAMPAWTPGSYLIREYARHVYDVRARAGDRRLRVERRDKQTWRVHHGGSAFRLSYRVYAAERSVRASHVDDTHASLNGASVFMYLVGNLGRACEVEMELPDGWKAFSALRRVRGSAPRVKLRAADYDALVDGPIELGRPQVSSFDVGGTTFDYVLTGGARAGADLSRLSDESKTIVGTFARLMGSLPMRRYVFLMDLTRRGGGGLEHADSTMMKMSRDAFATDEGYARAARMTAHEFFHLWNVKRIHDRTLGPFDYARENHSELLWFHEGFTDTAESLALVRGGLVTPKKFLRRLGEGWTRYVRRPGRNHDPLTQLSFEAWTKEYRRSPNHTNVAVSYYTKGELIGFVLDIELRLRAAKRGATGDLFGVFRRLMKSHGSRGKGIVMGDIVAAASAEAGEDMKWFFDKYVRGTEALPLPAALEGVGVHVEAKVDPTRRVFSGLTLRHNEVRNVEPDSPADRAGVMRDDEIVAVAGNRTDDAEAVERRLDRVGPGAAAALHVFRDGRMLELSVKLEANRHKNYAFSLEAADKLSPEVKSIRDAWLAVF